ncbi:hypothetical protein BGX33_009276 [Mortierella sp. NVP41]|nr:hypothetical protein BGX33_009276 [Mortierella sp. NVP41]
MDNDGSTTKDVPSQDKDGAAQETWLDSDNHNHPAAEFMPTTSSIEAGHKRQGSPLEFPQTDANQEPKRRRSSSPTNPCTSDDDDLALLQEVSRIKAQLEAKLRAKQEKKARSAGADNDIGRGRKPPTARVQSSHIVGRSSPHTTTRCPRPQQSWTPMGPATVDDSHTLTTADTTTPPTTRTPLSSPGFRTPSPPARTKMLMSPTSGASARKRQHSPSPLPRRSPRLTLPPRGTLSTTPLGALSGQGRFLQRLDEAAETGAASSIEARATAEVDTPLEKEVDDFDDALLEAALDQDDFDQPSPKQETMNRPVPAQSLKKEIVKQLKSTTPTKRRSDYDFAPSSQHTDSTSTRTTVTSLTDIVIAKQQERIAAQTARQGPRATFLTVGAVSSSVSIQEATRLGHKDKFDPLSGVRVRARITSCADVARMTRSMHNIPIKDESGIRERTEQRAKAGLLPSSASAGVLRSGIDATKGSGSSDTSPGHWMVAGVIGAKSKPKMTAKKVQYCHFQLSDLRSAAINVFLFRKVMERHYEGLRLGDVVAIMNPKVLSQAERAGTLGVEVEDPDCLLVIGTSEDFGLCEAVKLDGGNCNRVLDKRASSYCNHHIMMVANKGRNQRGSLIVGTSSILDLDKNAARSLKPPGLHRPGSSSSSGFFQGAGKGPQETTYLFDDGGVGTSLMADPKKIKKGVAPADEGSVAFLMTQNNPGGHYLRQAMESKDVTKAKDVPSPKTPTKNSELFPAEMVRRMGYDPVTGQFVPGSPKRMNEDPEARERSLRLLAERVRSPPMSPLSSPSGGHRLTMVVKGMTRVIAQPKAKAAHAPGKSSSGKEIAGDVFFRERGASAVPGSGGVGGGSPSIGPKKWVDLDGSSDSDPELDADGKPFLSLNQQRTKNLLEARGGGGGSKGESNGRPIATLSTGSAPLLVPSTPRMGVSRLLSEASGRNQVPTTTSSSSSASSASKTMLMQRTEARKERAVPSAAVPSDTQPSLCTPIGSKNNVESSSGSSNGRSNDAGGSISSSIGSSGVARRSTEYVDLSD